MSKHHVEFNPAWLDENGFMINVDKDPVLLEPRGVTESFTNGYFGQQRTSIHEGEVQVYGLHNKKMQIVNTPADASEYLPFSIRVTKRGPDRKPSITVNQACYITLGTFHDLMRDGEMEIEENAVDSVKHSDLVRGVLVHYIGLCTVLKVGNMELGERPMARKINNIQTWAPYLDLETLKPVMKPAGIPFASLIRRVLRESGNHQWADSIKPVPYERRQFMPINIKVHFQTFIRMLNYCEGGARRYITTEPWQTGKRGDTILYTREGGLLVLDISGEAEDVAGRFIDIPERCVELYREVAKLDGLSHELIQQYLLEYLEHWAGRFVAYLPTNIIGGLEHIWADMPCPVPIPMNIRTE